MSRYMPLILVLAIAGFILYLLNGWWAVERQANAFADEVRTEILGGIEGRMDIDRIRQQIKQLAVDRDVLLDTKSLLVLLAPPDHMTEETREAAEQAGINVDKIATVNLHIELGEGYARRAFNLTTQRPFAIGETPRLVDKKPKEKWRQ